ncbi:MAG: ABC transporter permease subunit [Gammaproteobacteria bacterium]|jgi:putative spermidine/putrescine transport system permease protein|nr:ABC transporter permease subunit [Gammaproteobacteria bacterium]
MDDHRHGIGDDGLPRFAETIGKLAQMIRRNLWSKLILLVVAAFYVLPMIAMARFSFQRVPVIKLGWSTLGKNWTAESLMTAITSDRFLEAAWLSVRLGVLSVVLGLVILVPTTVYVHVAKRNARPYVEFLSMLPYVVPPIALVVGISGAMKVAGTWFLASPFSLVPFYVVISLPFTFRALDVSLGATDLKTLVEASRSLGANWTRTTRSVILPNLKVGIINASFLCFATVLGEYTIASLLLKFTLPAYLAESQGSNPQGSFSVGLLLLVVSSLLFGFMNRLSKRKGQVLTGLAL